MSIENAANRVIKAHLQVMSKYLSHDECMKEREKLLEEAIRLYHNDSMEALRIAANTIYFDDSSDYRSALFEIVNILAPKVGDQLLNKTYEYVPRGEN